VQWGYTTGEQVAHHGLDRGDRFLQLVVFLGLFALVSPLFRTDPFGYPGASVVWLASSA
jgi:hypothetical protein